MYAFFFPRPLMVQWEKHKNVLGFFMDFPIRLLSYAAALAWNTAGVAPRHSPYPRERAYGMSHYTYRITYRFYIGAPHLPQCTPQSPTMTLIVLSVNILSNDPGSPTSKRVTRPLPAPIFSVSHSGR